MKYKKRNTRYVLWGNVEYWKAFAIFMGSSGSFLIKYTCSLRYHMVKLFRNLCNKDKYLILPIYLIYSHQILRKIQHYLKCELTLSKWSFSPHTKWLNIRTQYSFPVFRKIERFWSVLLRKKIKSVGVSSTLSSVGVCPLWRRRLVSICLLGPLSSEHACLLGPFNHTSRHCGIGRCDIDAH